MGVASFPFFFFSSSLLQAPSSRKGAQSKKNKNNPRPQPKKKSTVSHHNSQNLQEPSCCASRGCSSSLPSFPSFLDLPFYRRSRPHLFLFFGQPQVGSHLPPKFNCLSAIPIFLPSSNSPAEHGTSRVLYPAANAVYVII